MVELEHLKEQRSPPKLDSDGWAFRVERYLRLNPMIEDEKIETVAIAMEGKALAWFQFVEDFEIMMLG